MGVPHSEIKAALDAEKRRSSRKSERLRDKAGAKVIFNFSTSGV